jgi:hypothetical protein
VAAGLDDAARLRFERLVEMHLRYRFDPAGIDARERALLREVAAGLVEGLRGNRSIPRSAATPFRD